jgi:hypothetical protein
VISTLVSQVAMAYLESIIDDPFSKEEEDDEEHVEDAEGIDEVAEQLSKATLGEHEK